MIRFANVCRTAAIGVSLMTFSTQAIAAPQGAPPTGDTAAPTTTAAPPTTAAEAPNDDMDLAAQRADADARAAAEPSAQNHRRAAQLAEQAGAFTAAVASYEKEIAARPADDKEGRATAASDLARVRDRARGLVPDEGASTHRGALDAKWSPKPAEPPPAHKAAPPLPDRPTDDRIVRKWYFWVTLGAIAASAAAVTAIAVKASRDDKPDVLDRTARWPTGGVRWGFSSRR